ncbi:MAG: RICIN domain-containing protein [Flavobacterium sp.]
MKKITISIVILLLFGFNSNAQISATANLIAQPIPDRTVSYKISASGLSKPIEWGLDLAWLSETNIRRGIAFMGADRVDVVRSSFMPTNPLLNGTTLQGDALTNTNLRINIIKQYLGTNTKVVINSDHPSVSSYFYQNAVNWAKLIDVTTKLHEAQGLTVTSVSPFNEPDYSATGQGSLSDFYNICGELRANTHFDNIRISGGNTLNNDVALTWYNSLKDRLDEGNTHQLAGSFNNYATFYETVRANGDHATNDELHNVMEAMVGVEYGLQTGIWWGTAELARGEFVKASDGVRLGYAEHRPNWSAASVYKNLDGKVQLFGGTSERQATTTTYRFVSKEKEVYYDGYGPQREYTMVLPGGTGYQQGQTNAERMVNVSWGDDIQPVIDGQYVLVNRNSGKVMEVAGGSTAAGANVQQGTYNGSNYQKWNVAPVSSRIGGDFSYFSIKSVNSGKPLDDNNFSLDNGSNIMQWDDSNSANQQRYLEYASNGWFYIRSRHSAKCLDVLDASTADGGNVVQWEKNNQTNQQWRFIPVGAAIEFVAPNAPTNLVAASKAESVALSWTANSESDLAGYTIFRAETSGGPYNTIARNVTSTSFVDNTVTISGNYFYKIKAVDKSLNASVYSNEVSAITTGSKDLVAFLQFDGNTFDGSENLNHSAVYGNALYVDDLFGTKALKLNGTTNFLQLPATLANQQEITIAAWVNWAGGASWQRIFDFGNDENEYLYLSPKSDTGEMRFAIKNGGAEQVLNAPALTSGVWSHVAITLGATSAKIYVNGVLKSESNTITVRPIDFKPVLNYIGRSQFSDPLFNGSIDAFRVYNYELNASEIAVISELPPNAPPVAVTENIVLAQGATATTLIGGTTSLLANDTDAEKNILTAILVTSPVNGVLTLNANGTFSYVHNGTNTTTDSFTYKANDGTSDSNVVTVTITVTPFALPYNNFVIETKSETCANKKNGQISIAATENYSYTATINNSNYNFINKSLTVSDLAPGVYTVCIGITGKIFKQCYTVTIAPGGTIVAKSTTLSSNKVAIEITDGTAPFEVFVNGQSQFETNAVNFTVDAEQGDLIEVMTAKPCEGTFAKTLVNGTEVFFAYPNPTSGFFEIVIPTSKKDIYIELYSVGGKLISKITYSIVNHKVNLNLEKESTGVYIAKVYAEEIINLTVIKK